MLHSKQPYTDGRFGRKKMQTVIGIILCILALALVVVGAIWKKRVLAQTYADFAEKEHSYTLVVNGYDWGPAVDKVIVNAKRTEKSSTDEQLTEGSLSPDQFSVTVTTAYFDGSSNTVATKTGTRTVVATYRCDIDGNKTDDPAESHIALEFNAEPFDDLSTPFLYDATKQVNDWKEKYDYCIESPLFATPVTIYNELICPQADRFRTVVCKKNTQLHAASFTPENHADGKKHPLIVWFHGAGEGGTDPWIILLGNKVTALSEEKIQQYFNGAFVLCPQTPTIWMNAGDGPYDICSPETPNKSSQYTAACKEIIDRFIKANPAIDTKRIYIGGCSNGGYMTVNMLLTYPHFFAAAFPICEAYNDSWLSDAQIVQLAQTPLWFTAAKTDTTVPPEQYTVSTVKRIREHNKSIHFSYFDDVHDTSGKILSAKNEPYKYNGHWSWIYALNDECSDGAEKGLWQWLSQQTLAD